MMQDAHEMLQPAREETTEGRQPIQPRFVLEQDQHIAQISPS